MIITKPGVIGEIRFDRPAKRNALSKADLLAIPDGVDSLVSSGSRAIVLAGSDTTFTAGADLSEFSNTEDDIEIEEGLSLAANGLSSAPIPVIAAIEGPCLGAGVELAASCDFRVAGRGAFFRIPAAKLGILYRPEGVARLVERLGAQTTRRLLLLNEQLEPAQIADIVVPDGSTFAKAETLARHVVELVPEAIAASKQLISEITSAGLDPTDWEQVRRRLLAGR